MQPVQKFIGHLLLPSLKVNKRIVDASVQKFIGHLLLPSLKVNKRIVDATCTKRSFCHLLCYLLSR